MFELIGTQFDKGVLDFRLEKSLPQPISFIVGLGPIRGRLLALVFLGLASALSLARQPATYFVKNKIFEVAVANQVTITIIYLLFGIGLVLYVLVFFVRKESMDLSFDRADKMLRFRHFPKTAKMPAREGICDFGSLEAIEVFGPSREPKTPNGFIELRLKNHSKPYHCIRFKLLSDEQFKIYPLNLSQMTGKTPVGDWSDPGDLPNLTTP